MPRRMVPNVLLNLLKNAAGATMKIDWSALKAELAVWRRDNLALPIWWRDDDAITHTPALDRLTLLSENLGVPVHLAVIPKHADQTLVSACHGQANLIPMVHGWAHENHAPQEQKKAEFGHERPNIMQEAQSALARMRGLFDADFIDVFVPPWNRVTPALTARLSQIGYGGLSTFTPRMNRFAAPGLVQVNTHVDPINWHGGGGLVAPDRQVATLISLLKDRRQGRSDMQEPLGFLTHHLVHDPDIWNFTHDCLLTLQDGGAKSVNLCIDRSDLP